MIGDEILLAVFWYYWCEEDKPSKGFVHGVGEADE
jgi:hypothetical protein